MLLLYSTCLSVLSLFIRLVEGKERLNSNIQRFHSLLCWMLNIAGSFQIPVSFNKGIQCLWNPLLHTKSVVNGLVVDRFLFLGTMAVPGLKSETPATAESTDNNHSFLWLLQQLWNIPDLLFFISSYQRYMSKYYRICYLFLESWMNWVRRIKPTGYLLSLSFWVLHGFTLSPFWIKCTLGFFFFFPNFTTNLRFSESWSPM